VKCKDFTNFTTIHCFVCNVCVEEWDHHCFWLNVCINNHNKMSFRLFFYSIIVCVVMNSLFVFFNFFLSFGGRLSETFLISFFNLGQKPSPIELNGYLIGWQCVFGILLLLILYVIFFVTCPTLKTFCEHKNKNQLNINDIESKLISKSLNDKQSLNSYTL